MTQATERAKICTLDPNCAEYVAGALGDDHLPGAACHACLSPVRQAVNEVTATLIGAPSLPQWPIVAEFRSSSIPRMLCCARNRLTSASGLANCCVYHV